MIDVDCTPGREPRSIAASVYLFITHMPVTDWRSGHMSRWVCVYIRWFVVISAVSSVDVDVCDETRMTLVLCVCVSAVRTLITCRTTCVSSARGSLWLVSSRPSHGITVTLVSPVELLATRTWRWSLAKREVNAHSVRPLSPEINKTECQYKLILFTNDNHYRSKIINSCSRPTTD